MLTPDSSETLSPNSPPDRIYLQWHGDGTPDDHGNVYEGEVSWCKTRVFEHDVEYVRASMAVPQPIETAPKDGGYKYPILAFCPQAGWLIMRWEDQSGYSKPRPYWSSDLRYRDVKQDREDQPTHWLPLPPALTSSGSVEPKR